MAKREIEKKIDDVLFNVLYTPSNEMMEQTPISKGDFEFHILAEVEEEDDGEIKDVEKFKSWLMHGLEGNNLLDKIVGYEDGYKALIKEFGVNPLSIDVAFFRMSCEYYNLNDDQRFEIESTKAIGFTVKGRKYLEKVL